MNVCGVYGVETCPCHKQQLLRAGRVSFGGLLRESGRLGHLTAGARARAPAWEPRAHGP
jgi:hypothetical protein